MYKFLKNHITVLASKCTVYALGSSFGGAGVGISGYSSFTPFSHSNWGQQSGNAAVLLVFSDSLHLGLALGRGPQSSTSSKSRPSSSALTQVERPQKGANSQECPGSMVAHLVDAKHWPGKSGSRGVFANQMVNQKNTAIATLNKGIYTSISKLSWRISFVE